MSDELVSVYQAQTLPEAELLHQRLTDEGIDSFVEQTASPFDGLVGANQGTHVRVRKQDQERARGVMEIFLAERTDEHEDRLP